MRWLLVVLVLGCGAKSALEIEQAPVDGGPRDMGPDLVSCVATGPETCDGVDQDCDGFVDEDLPLRPVGESVLFRDTGDGDTGDCDTCGWVRDLALESTRAGILAAWHLGFNGSDPQPNTYTRLLDDGGGPLGEITRRETLLNGGFTTSSPHPEGMLLTYCGRRRADDVATRALLDARGTPIWEVRAEPRNRSCGAWRPVSLRAGRRIYTAWTDNSTGPVMGHEHLLDVADADGETIDWHELLPEGDGKPALAAGAERVVHVVAARGEPRESFLVIQPIDLDGTVRTADQTTIPAMAPETFYGEPWVFPTETGFIVHMKEQARDPGGRVVIALDARGAIVSGPRREEAGLEIINTIDHALAYGRGVVMAHSVRADGEFAYRVAALDERGVTTDSWNPRTYDEGFGDGTFVAHRGQLFLAYRRGSESPDGRFLVQLRIWPLACEP